MKKLRKISTILFSLVLMLSAGFGTYALCSNQASRVESGVTDGGSSDGSDGGSGSIDTGDTGENNEQGDVSGDTTTTDTTSYVSVGEIFDSESGDFDLSNMNQLLQYITGDETVSTSDMTTVDSLAATTASAADIRANVVGSKTSSQDVQVTFGGLTWQVVYLSTDNDGNAILTLWLSDNYQSAWEDRSSDEGTLYGYIDGALYSDWSNDWYSSTVGTYPSNMYGTSYINAVTLNNGGYYATSNSAVTTATQSADSAFAIFTMSQSDLDAAGSSLTSLTDYLVTPRNVSWQETENAYPDGYSYTVSNDAYGTPSGTTNWYSSTYNYTGYTYYDSWADGYIWLPSIAETGYSSSYDGLWETSTYQRQNYNGSTTSFTYSDGIGSSNTNYSTTAYTFSWLRSAYYYFSYYSNYLYSSGANYSYYYVYISQAVRPSLHLNLDSAALSAAAGSPFQYDSSGKYWYVEDGVTPQSVYGTDGQTSPTDIDASSASDAYTIRLSTSTYAEVLIYNGTDSDYAKVTIGDSFAWFNVEPVRWVVCYGETLTLGSTAVTAQIVTAGYVCSSAGISFSWAMSSVLGMSVETLEAVMGLTTASVGEFSYDSFSGTISQLAVTDDATTLSSKIAVSSVEEIDALGGSYASTCTDFVAFLLSGGTSTDGASYSADYWTRDLAATLDSESTYYSNTNTTFTYSGALNNGVYVTSSGTLSNAKLKTCMGARLTMAI